MRFIRKQQQQQQKTHMTSTNMLNTSNTKGKQVVVKGLENEELIQGCDFISLIKKKVWKSEGQENR